MMRFRCTECSYSETLSHRQAQDRNVHGGSPACPQCGARIGFLRPSDEIKGLLTVFVLLILLGLSIYQGPPASPLMRTVRLGIVLLTVIPGGWWLFLNIAFWLRFKGPESSLLSLLSVLTMFALSTAGQVLLLCLWVLRWSSPAG
jgi:hypothetical protein